MDAPIYDFVQNYINSNASRFHMPGHKGSGKLGIEKLDITEIMGADELYYPRSIILQSENNAAKLFNTEHTFYSTEGSSQCIKAMLYIAMTNAKKTKKRPFVLAARNVHKAFIQAAALLDADVEWLYPNISGSICSSIILPNELNKKLSSFSEMPFAVYVTSPDYLGGVSDIKGLAKICSKYNVPLIVDNAHGAYLNFLEQPLHPIFLGAAMCCDSAHKTLPVLTGGAYLHISKNAPKSYIDCARNAMALFGSTSPSYLILQSLDLCNKYIDNDYKVKLKNFINELNILKQELSKFGFFDKSNEPMKIVLNTQDKNITGFELADFLRKNKIECEFCDFNNVVLMFTIENSKKDIQRIISAISALKYTKTNKIKLDFNFIKGVKAMSIREAVFSKHKTVDVKSAIGKICGSPIVSCPPAIPICISGEIITNKTVNLFEFYNIDKIEIVDED